MTFPRDDEKKEHRERPHQDHGSYHEEQGESREAREFPERQSGSQPSAGEPPGRKVGEEKAPK